MLIFNPAERIKVVDLFEYIEVNLYTVPSSLKLHEFLKQKQSDMFESAEKWKLHNLKHQDLIDEIMKSFPGVEIDDNWVFCHWE